jgi:hypothetical protein
MEKARGRLKKYEKNGQTFPTYTAKWHSLKVEVTNCFTGPSLKYE